MNPSQKEVRDSWHQMSKARSALEAKTPASRSSNHAGSACHEFEP
jgi:hypothetical protein